MVINTLQPCIYYTQLLYNAIPPIHKPYTPLLPYSQASCLFRQTTSSPCEAGRGWRRLDRSLRVKERLISFSDDIQEFFEGRLYVSVCKYIGGWRCAMWVYQNNRWPPAEMFSKQIFHSQRSISPAFMGQEAKKTYELASPLRFVKILISIFVISSFVINMKIQQYGLLCWHQAESRWILTAAALSIKKAKGLIHWKKVSYLHLALPPFSGLWNDFVKTFLNKWISQKVGLPFKGGSLDCWN